MARRQIAAIALASAAEVELIGIISPGYPTGNDPGLKNAMAVDYALLAQATPMFCKVFVTSGATGWLFVPYQYGFARNFSISFGSPPVNPAQWREVNTNVEFERWALPNVPDRWAVANSDALNFVSKDYVDGNPIAARLTSEDGSAFNLSLNLPGLTDNIDRDAPYNAITRRYEYSIVINEPSSTPIYVHVQGIGDLNGGDPINDTARTITEAFDFPPGETLRSLELQIRPAGQPGYASIESASLLEQINFTPISPREEWSFNYRDLLFVEDIPKAFPRRENSTTYQDGDVVQFGWRWYTCATAGTTGFVMPAWDQDTGNILDGSVLWTPSGNYYHEALMANPDLVDVFGGGTTVQSTPPGGGPDIWIETGDPMDSTGTTDQVFMRQGNPIIWEATTNTTTSSLYKDAPVGLIPVGDVDNTWHTVLAIIQWTSGNPTAVIEIKIDGVVYVTIEMQPGGVKHTVTNNQPSEVAEAFEAGYPFALGVDMYAYWVCIRFADGAFPIGASFARLQFYPAGNQGGNNGLGCAAIALQMALGVKGPYWPASVPYSTNSAYHPGDRILLDIASPARPSNSPFDPRRGTLFLMASPIRNEQPGQVIDPPYDERLIGVGGDCLFGVGTDNRVYASQGASRQYLAQGQTPILDYPPDYYVVTWDADANRTTIYEAWARHGEVTAYRKGLESGCVRLDGDGYLLECSIKIYRSWHIHHAALFDRVLDDNVIAGMLPP